MDSSWPPLPFPLAIFLPPPFGKSKNREGGGGEAKVFEFFPIFGIREKKRCKMGKERLKQRLYFRATQFGKKIRKQKIIFPLIFPFFFGITPPLCRTNMVLKSRGAPNPSFPPFSLLLLFFEWVLNIHKLPLPPFCFFFFPLAPHPRPLLIYNPCPVFSHPPIIN